jgi:hypothetical protein
VGATVRNLDFTNVKEQGGFNPRRKPEGDYRARIVAVDDHQSKDGNDSWVFTIKIDGDARASYPYYCGVDEKQLWKIRALCVAAGLAVPKKRVKVDPNKLVNREIGISLEDDEYEGKLKSVVAGTMPVSDLTDAENPDDEDEEPTPPRKRASKKAPEPEPDDDDDDDEDDEDETPPPPVKKRRAKKAAPAPEPEDDHDEDEDDDEPAPPPKKKRAAKKVAKKAPPVEDDDEDDDLDLDEL